MPPNKQSRWECSRRRGGTTHRGSRSLCAAALKFRDQLFLNMDSELFSTAIAFFMQFLSQQQTNQHLSDFIGRVYQKTHKPQSPTDFKKYKETFQKTFNQRFYGLVLNRLRRYCKDRSQQVKGRMEIFDSSQIKTNPKLDNNYYQCWQQQWKPKDPFEQVSCKILAMEVQQFKQQFAQRNRQELFCWLVYLNFCQIYQKNQTLAKFCNDRKSQGQDIQKNKDKKQLEIMTESKGMKATESDFIESVFSNRLVKNSKVQDKVGSISDALNAAALQFLLFDGPKPIEQGQTKKEQQQSAQVALKGMIADLKTFQKFATGFKECMDEEEEEEENAYEYINKFIETIRVLISQLEIESE